jgi:thiosulfate/3-mercaptopyruvate sulfurtransferase
MQEGGRAGHTPGAVWLPLDIAQHGPDEVRDLCAAAGVDPDRHLVVYCTIGNRASQVWFALKHLLGYPRVSVYYGSWAESAPRVPCPSRSTQSNRQHRTSERARGTRRVAVDMPP